MKQTITRKGSFDSGHRVMHERFKCFNHHGHTFLYELTFSWEQAEKIGYSIDFKEIKRVACQWIDDVLDHGFLANPKDTGIVNLCRETGTKLFLMHLLDDDGYCNPSAENIAKELFYAVSTLMDRDDESQFKLDRIRLYETPNCFVECEGLNVSEMIKLRDSGFRDEVLAYKAKMGIVEYDERKLGDEEHA